MKLHIVPAPERDRDLSPPVPVRSWVRRREQAWRYAATTDRILSADRARTDR